MFRAGKTETITCLACKSEFEVVSLSAKEMKLLVCPICKNTKNKELIEALDSLVDDERKRFDLIKILAKMGK